MRRIFMAAMVLLCATSALGRDGPEVLAAAADAVIAESAAGDTTALAEIAARKRPDVWIVLEEVAVRGQFDAADALANVAPENGREALVAYAALRRKQPVDKAHYATYHKASDLLGRGARAEAIALLEALPDLPPSVLASRVAYDHSLALWNAGRHGQAIVLHGRSALVAKSIGWTREWFIRSYQAGDLARQKQDLVACEAWWREGLAAAEATGIDAYAAEIGARLAICLSQRGNSLEALEVNRGALARYKKLGSKRDVAVVLGNVGTELTILGRLAEALEAQTEAFRIKEELGDMKGAAATLGNMAAIYNRRGDWEGAERIHRDALARKRALGDRKETASSLASLGDLYRVLGDYTKAFSHLEESLAIFEAIDRKLSIGFVLGRLSAVHLQIGNRERASDLGSAALKILVGIGAENQVAYMRQSMADLYRIQGKYAEALALQQQVLAFTEKTGNPSRISGAHQSIAGTYGRWDRPQDGMEHAEKALALAMESKERAAIAYAQLGLGDLHGRLGHYKQAVKHLDAARARSAHMNDVIFDVAIHETRVEAAVTAERHGTAVTAALAAAKALRKRFRHLGHEERARAGERWMTALVLGVESARIKKNHNSAFTLLEAGRASALREALGGGNALRAALVPAELRRAGADAAAAETAAASRLRRAIEGGAAAEEIRACRAALGSARTQLEDAAVRMERVAKVAADVVQPKPAKLSDCQRLLAGNRTMLLFTMQGEQASVIILTKKSIRHVGLGPSATIRAACKRLHTDTAGALDAKAVAELRALVVSPLGLKASATKVWISPDGPLAYVPFALLFREAEVGYVPSASTALQLSVQGQSRGKRVLALGDPTYGGAESAAGASTLRSGFELTALPASGEEAKAVGDVVLLGDRATEEGLAEALAKQTRWRAVHFACHGLVDPQRPSFCALALTASEGSDGFLTALEIMRSTIPADLVALSACETARGKIYDGEGLVGLTRAFMLAGSPRVLVSLWKVDDKATRILMEAFYAKWKQGGGAAAALRHAQEHVRTLEEVRADPEASARAGHTVQTKTTPYSDPRYWAGWQLWGLAD